ncbi:MAG: YfhO family protein [Bacteroidales bacterium]|nr:YfhO family protein [Bacteroidales bacterium]
MKRSKKSKDNIKTKNVVKKNTKQTKTEYTQTFFFEKYFNVWTLSLLIFVIGFFAFSKYLTGEYLFFFKDIGSDSINQNYPGLVHKINLLKEGFFSEWSFSKGMGDEYITGIASEPYGLLRQTIDYLGASFGGANFFIFGRFLRIFIFSFLFSGIISYLYFRTLSFEKHISFIGALLISFSGYMVVGAGWGFSSHIFKAMFLLFAFEQLYLKKRWYFFPFAVILLSSNPFVLFIYSVFLVLYSLFRYFSEEKNKLPDYFKLSGKMILLGFVGLMMNFSHLLRSFLKMYNSPRVAGDVSYSNILSAGQDITEHGNLAGTTIFRFFSSDILGTGSNFHGWSNYLEAPLFYIGLLTLLIFPQVFIRLNKRKKIIFGTFLGFWVLTLFFPYLRYSMLAFTGDYFRYGFDFFIPFTLLLFAIFAADEIIKTAKINLPLLAASLTVLIILLFVPYESISSVNINSTIRNSVIILLVLYALFIFLLSKPKYKSLSKSAIMLLVIFELSYFSYQSYATREPITKTEFKKDKAGYADGSIKAVKLIKSTDKTPFFRTEKDYQSGNAVHSSLNDALAQDYFGTTSYSSFNQLNYVRFLEKTGVIQKGDETATRWLTGLRGSPLLQTFGNVKYHLSKSKNPEFLLFGFDSLSTESGITILKNRYYLPFGYTYDKYIDSEDFKNLINYQVTGQSLTNIYTDLSRTVEQQKLTEIISKLQTVINIRYSNNNTFNDVLIKQLGTEDAEKYSITISKYSVSNFRNQIALLSGFVYEKEFNKNVNISSFEKIQFNDSNILVPASSFNFDIYKKITDELKQDTFQIENFSNSNIKGKIILPKTKMLFFTIPYDEGWKIKVNGKEELLQRINFGFAGIVLPKGSYNIELYYVPKHSRFANMVSLISILSFWSFLFYFIIKKRRKQKA